MQVERHPAFVAGEAFVFGIIFIQNVLELVAIQQLRNSRHGNERHLASTLIDTRETAASGRWFVGRRFAGRSRGAIRLTWMQHLRHFWFSPFGWPLRISSAHGTSE